MAELNHRLPDGTTQGDHWEEDARSGSGAAIKRLTPPEFPDAVSYLWLWAMELHGRSGIGMSGLAPLTYEAIIAWSKLRSVLPTPSEVAALIAIDSALLSGGTEKKSNTTEAGSEPEPQPSWPERKPGVVPQFVPR